MYILIYVEGPKERKEKAMEKKVWKAISKNMCRFSHFPSFVNAIFASSTDPVFPVRNYCYCRNHCQYRPLHATGEKF